MQKHVDVFDADDKLLRAYSITMTAGEPDKEFEAEALKSASEDGYDAIRAAVRPAP